MYGIDRKRYFWVCTSALLQGFLLGKYLYTSSGVFLALPLNLVVVVPFAFWLGQEYWGRRLKRFLGSLALLLTLFYAYWLWSVFPPESEIYVLPTQNMNLTRISIATFLLLPFFQCRIASWSWRVPYSDIFFQLCRNVFLLFQSVIVTAVFWTLLLTASLLFDIIGLTFVPQVIFNPLVAFPLTSLTIALSITLALKHPGIDSVGRWILAILAWLLPPFSVLSTVFVVSLLFSGLQNLWNTGQASTLMLLLQFASILLANAAWLDGTRNPFSNKAVDFIAKLSLLPCLPIYTALCFRSLGLRIQQYGWSVDRIHATFFVVVAGIWGLGYAGSVFLRQWPSAVGRINTSATLILTVIVVAMNSPLLDPYRLSADNQVERLLEGSTRPENFDFLYLRFNLGRYGDYALSRLRSANGDRGAAIREYLDPAITADPKEHWASVQNGLVPERRRREILAGARVYPEGKVLSPALVNDLASQWGEPGFFLLRHVRKSSDLAFSFKKVLTGTGKGTGKEAEDGQEELLLITKGMGMVFDISSGKPRAVGVFSCETAFFPESEDVKIVEPRFKDIEMGERRYQILPLVHQ
ncbi:MAG: DUF4153 domain-containing protein [Synergistaceae bacterium]|jgi:hypothetical protein|nr:DUF4153 domain-containing protein [Synergistaceae bacterium]